MVVAIDGEYGGDPCICLLGIVTQWSCVNGACGTAATKGRDPVADTGTR